MSDCPIHGNQWCTCNSEVDPSPEWIKAVSDDILLRHHNDCAVHSPTLKPCSCGLETRMRSELSRLRASLSSAESHIAIAVEALEWYREQARLCRLIHGEGDEARRTLCKDGGEIARAALSAIRSKP